MKEGAPATRLRKLLSVAYPDARCSLHHQDAYQLLVATILSAQCTDARVNQVTPPLFRRYPTPGDLARASQEELEALVRSTGFYKSKAKSLRGAAQAIVERHGGKVPGDMESLLLLPGVARKTANVVLGNAFGVEEGFVVDTHVARVSRRLGLSAAQDPVKIESDLVKVFASGGWTLLSHRIIAHGRAICTARKPECGRCPLAEHCPRIGVTQ